MYVEFVLRLRFRPFPYSHVRGGLLIPCTCRLPIGTSPQALPSQNAGLLENSTLSRDVFDQAQRQIYDLTETDAFPRFTQFIHAQMQVRCTHSDLPL